MIDSINRDAKCHPILCHVLEEEGVSIGFGGELLDQHGDTDLDRVVIMKPDGFYNTVDFAKPPKSADGFIVVKDENCYHFYIAELKSSKGGKIKAAHINEKFSTIFERFITDDFAHIFIAHPYSLKSLNLWLICDPFQLGRKGLSSDEYIIRTRRALRSKGLMADFATSLKSFSFKGFNVTIKPLLSPPTIEQAHYIDLLAEGVIS